MTGKSVRLPGYWVTGEWFFAKCHLLANKNGDSFFRIAVSNMVRREGVAALRSLRSLRVGHPPLLRAPIKKTLALWFKVRGSRLQACGGTLEPPTMNLELVILIEALLVNIEIQATSSMPQLVACSLEP